MCTVQLGASLALFTPQSLIEGPNRNRKEFHTSKRSLPAQLFVDLGESAWQLLKDIEQSNEGLVCLSFRMVNKENLLFSERMKCAI